MNGVRRGNIDEVLPDEAYEAVPPPEFDLMLGQEQIATFELMNSLDDYYTDDLALTTMDAQSGSSYAKRLPTFVNLIALLGGTYTDHGCDCVVGAVKPPSALPTVL